MHRGAAAGNSGGGLGRGGRPRGGALRASTELAGQWAGHIPQAAGAVAAVLFASHWGRLHQSHVSEIPAWDAMKCQCGVMILMPMTTTQQGVLSLAVTAQLMLSLHGANEVQSMANFDNAVQLCLLGNAGSDALVLN